MIQFIKSTNLPEGEVASLVCGGLNPDLISFLRSRGIEIFLSKENKCSDKAISRHSDLSVLYVGGGKVIVDKGQASLISELRSENFTVIETTNEVGGIYPHDCILNHAIVGEYIIGKSDIFDESVKECCKDFEVISVKQGYSKCSVLVVDDKSVITDDESIARKTIEMGIECLLVSKGDVFLDGHEYGFIGGASGKISKDEILFFGDITKHRDYKLIKDFLEKRSIKIICFDFPLTDFGGIIPIKENFF